MIYAVNCAALSLALDELKKIAVKNRADGVKTVVFCEDRLTLAAERTVCAALGGTFDASVYTLARFLSTELGKPENVLSGQGSAMAVRKIIEERKDELTLFKRLSYASAAQQVYDTIALLYSSRVSAEDAAKAAEGGGLLGGKLRDLSVVYSAYSEYLKESGFEDRNAYLRKLAPVIEKSPKINGECVVFLGFQAFTSTSGECVRAAMKAAGEVHGLFIGGAEDVYVNEAGAAFIGYSREFGGVKISARTDGLCPEADALRRGVFNPESFYREPMPTDKVSVFEAADFEEELEFIAASIKKHVIDGKERYAKISVMLPDLAAGERALARVFARYNIPYYADRQRTLSEHPLCAFLTGFLSCVTAGCRFDDVDGVIASPYFPAERRDKDIFRNYLLRLANHRGGVKKQPSAEVLKNFGFDEAVISFVRETFLKGYALLTAKGGIRGICGGLLELLEAYGVKKTLADAAERYADIKPAAAQFGARAYDGAVAVIAEAESVCTDGTPLSEFVKILKSGFAAAKISIIPPKADAVFVGDLSATANTGSNVVFAAGLTGEVPSASPDTSLLTDREITALEGVNLNISPKIRQVNARRNETCALNLCAFKDKLYLSYTAGDGGASEIIDYARAVFATKSGAKLESFDMKRLKRTGRAVPFYCSEKLPALRYLRKEPDSRFSSAVYAVLRKNGYGEEADLALKKPVKRGISCGQRLYLRNGSLSPTALETYFSCPYLGFMRQGLKVCEREEGAVRPVDTGNFIHAVLQDIAKEVGGIDSAEKLAERAKQVAEDKLSKPPYSALSFTKSGQYVADGLIAEAVAVCGGMYEQLANSSFKVAGAEVPCEVKLSGGVRVYGRIDRVDESDGLVRVVDYKTGNIDGTPAKYYAGLKLQLQLYLLSASEGKRPVGAYYFPAAVEYREKEDGVFRLTGFMDASDEVVSASDKTVQNKCKSAYVNAYYGAAQKSDGAMSRDDFGDFLGYARLIADGGAREMIGGNVTPSPAKDVCKYCKAGGSCGIELSEVGERKVKSVKCAQIAQITRNERGEVECNSPTNKLGR